MTQFFPTRVGMVRWPTVISARDRLSPFSPHAWGWSAVGRRLQESQAVFPTRVGMVRLTNPNGLAAMFSPPAWGWSGVRRLGCRIVWVSPPAWGWSERPLV